MELEELTKSQIVLLTLLVSFVTSIATGIVTVSLIEQAPKDVTRVIQRTVVKTVEKVTPPEVQTKVVTREKTVVVPEKELIAEAVAQVEPAIVAIYTDEEEPSFLARGVALSTQGIVATDAAALTDAETYRIVAGNDTYVASLLRRGGERQIALLQIEEAERVPAPAALYEEPLKLGMRVVGFGGDTRIVLAEGIVSALGTGVFEVSIPAEAIVPGMVLINSEGAVVGMSTGAARALGKQWFVTGRSLQALLHAQTRQAAPEGETGAALDTETQPAAAAAAVDAATTTPQATSTDEAVQ